MYCYETLYQHLWSPEEQPNDFANPLIYPLITFLGFSQISLQVLEYLQTLASAITFGTHIYVPLRFYLSSRLPWF